MSKGAVDLPDPLEKPPLRVGPNTDDLLAQLAGEEVDRLLADAGVEGISLAKAAEDGIEDSKAVATRLDQEIAGVDQPLAGETINQALESSPAVAPQPAPEIVDQATSPVPQKQIPTPPPDAADSMANERPVDVGVISDDPADPLEAADAEISKELNNLFNQLTAESTPPPKKAPQEAGKSLAGDADQTSHAERKGLATDPPASSTQPSSPTSASDDRLPLWLRPLEWINLPMWFVSDETRETLGKIAIVTTINALAILAYVLLFRRP